LSKRESAASGSSFLRPLRMLEAIARSERPIAASELMHELGLPKPTVHRMIAALEKAGLAQRDPVAKRLVVGARLTALALDAIARSAQEAPRHQVLLRLTEESGETSTFTVFDQGEILLVDRVESSWPLRVNLYPGSRVPLHCTASGKLMLALQEEDTRERLLRAVLPLKAYTNNTIVQSGELTKALGRIRAAGYSTDDEEFMVGLVAIAVPVTHPASGQAIGTVSLNAPAARLRLARSQRHLAMLRRAAEAMSASFRPRPTARMVRQADRPR
jgi:DNA-binding IclR family transcriptional regulator